jgi:glucose-6-phosphate 1-epimerase
MSTESRISALNEEFRVSGVAQIVSGNGELPKIRIDTPAASAEIYLHGAQVTSWKPNGAEEVLFLSAKSNWSDGKAIRGGIPVCFPWFRAKADDPTAPSHGFVRTREWRIVSVTTEPDDSVIVRLATESDEQTRRWWPFDFELEYRIAVGYELKLELEVRNTGHSGLSFEEALHTYFNVGDVEKAGVRGLEGVAYLDNRDGNRRRVQTGELRLRAQTDNAYLEATGDIVIFDPFLRRELKTSKQNSGSTIAWNPWQDGASLLADLRDDEWRRMLCIEGGNILSSTVSLRPNELHRMSVELSAIAGSNG